jgi:hypothetical protein
MYWASSFVPAPSQFSFWDKEIYEFNFCCLTLMSLPVLVSGLRTHRPLLLLVDPAKEKEAQ